MWIYLFFFFQNIVTFRCICDCFLSFSEMFLHFLFYGCVECFCFIVRMVGINSKCVSSSLGFFFSYFSFNLSSLWFFPHSAAVAGVHFVCIVFSCLFFFCFLKLGKQILQYENAKGRVYAVARDQHAIR